VIVLAVFVLVLTGWLYTVVPTGFLPTKIKAISSVLFTPEGLLNTNDIMRRWNRTTEAAGNASNFYWWL